MLFDDRVIRSLGELRELLKTMSEELFARHVSEQHNDFANWTEHVFGLLDLAKNMRDAKTRKELLTVLYEF